MTRQPDTFPVRAVGVLTKGDPGVLVRHGKRRDAKYALAAAYYIVDGRDKRCCQVTGKPLQTGGGDEWRRIEHHHLEPRSRNRARTDDVDNILTVSAGVHALMHCGALVAVDAKGEETTHVSQIAGYRWTRRDRPPFRIVRER